MTSFTRLQISSIHEQLALVKKDLLASSSRDKQGLYWQSPYYETTDRFAFKTTIDIFNGNSGIALFYISLFEFSGDREELEKAAAIMDKVLQSEDVLKPRSFGFYTGLTGVAYVCIKLYELGKDEKYLQSASRLMLGFQENIVNLTIKADLLSGYSGSLLVFTLLYHHLGSKKLLAVVHQLIDRVINEARISEAGLKWDYNQSKSAFDSLAGFSHGASGIAYALMQVGNYFKNDGLIYLAEEALAYEMQYFHAESGNWLDLRLGKYRLSLPDAHRWDLNIFLPEMKKVNSWAHGAGGIGLARLYAYELTGKKMYFKQCQLVLERCLKDLKNMDRTDFTLCSGYIGILPFLSKFSAITGVDYKEIITSVTERAKDLYEKKKSYNTYIGAGSFDYGLLSGKAGVGYMLLQLLNRKKDSAVYPVLPKNEKITPVVDRHSKQTIQQQIFSGHYAKTIRLLNETAPGLLSELRAEDINEFEQQVCQLISRLPEAKNSAVAEMFDFEHKMAVRWKLHKGHLCYQKKNEFILEEVKRWCVVTDQELYSLSLQLYDHVSFYALSFRLKELLALTQPYQAVLFVSEQHGVNTVYIGQLSALITGHLDQQPMTGDKLIRLILDMFSASESLIAETTVLRERIILQIRSLLISGIIGVKEKA
ncbi:hypothetical protein TH53_13345 [Pedobacter lusitanus]|uniref:Lanthionine synthetase C-like protein n=1 Tax=Pedobacter lusitanus TaxID=1503925 RepID=A0A0D0FW87_9SPHI|nr:lanthionine synthetase LanC family protein [Pedobacter lusitanus]KIO76744.1 hypothetical protein TH53_13345 [Pedobacter lusitanus]